MNKKQIDAISWSTIGIVTVAVVVVMFLAGCNTIAGLGVDLTNAATWTEHKLSTGFDDDAPPADLRQYQAVSQRKWEATR